MCRVSLSVQDMRLPVIIINDCWEYIIELELELLSYLDNPMFILSML